MPNSAGVIRHLSGGAQSMYIEQVANVIEEKFVFSSGRHRERIEQFRLEHEQ